MSDQPKILYRVFGRHQIEDLLPLEDYRWKDRVVILTTTDYPASKYDEMKQKGFDIVPPICTNRIAGENSSVLLNSGLDYLRNRGEKYALLMASGFQGSMNFINNMNRNVMMEYPDRDIYFYLTEGVNGLSKANIRDGLMNLYENRSLFIPSESLAIVKIASVFPLDEEMTRKGSLGLSKEGIPLGGIELPITIMKLFATEGKVLSMCAIDSSLTRSPEIMVQSNHLGSLEFVERGAKTEYTSTGDKLARRTETIDKAMNVLNISPDTYGEIFRDTLLVREVDYIQTPSVN